MDTTGNKLGHEILFRGTVIYFIGTFISRMMALLLLPLITRKMSATDYGTFDLVSTLVVIAVPLFTLQSVEAVFKRLFGSSEKSIRILISNLMAILLAGAAFALGLIIAFSILGFMMPHIPTLFAYFVSNVLLVAYQRIARGLGFSKEFALSGVVNTGILLLAQLIGLIYFDIGVTGFIATFIFAQGVTVIYLELVTSVRELISVKLVNRATIKELVKFGLPLVPNNISWLSVNAINKILIATYLGLSSNAVFAISGKFTGIIITLTEVFKLAWQESAIVTYNEADRTKYFSEIFNQYLSVLIVSCSMALPVIKYLLPLLVVGEYSSAWVIIPPAIYGAGLSGVVAFYGVGYIAAGNTADAFTTTFTGGLVNVVTTFLLINYLGLFGPITGTLLAYLSIWILRHIRMRAFFQINIDFKRALWLVLIMLASSSSYYFLGLFANSVMFIGLTSFLLYDNFKVLVYMKDNLNKLLHSTKVQ